MTTKVKNYRSWQFYVVGGALLLGVFAWVDGRVFQGVGTAGLTFQAGLTSANQTTIGSDPAPSDATTSALANALQDVSGLNDMAVIPDGQGDGQFLVSAVVDVTEMSGGTGVTGSVRSLVNASVDSFFKDIYGAGQPVSQAEITFTQDGVIVGTAGLGKDAYKNMASTTMQGDLASALATKVPVQKNTSNDAWLEISLGQ